VTSITVLLVAFCESIFAALASIVFLPS